VGRAKTVDVSSRVLVNRRGVKAVGIDTVLRP
jgi:hypothetical protein